MATLKRGKIFYLVKRVPTDVAHLDTRKIVQISLKTDSGKEAAIKAVDVEEALMAYWDALRRNEGDPERYKALVKIAAARNLSYRPLRELYAAGGLEELLSRIQGLSDQDAANATLVDASLGGQARPALTLSMLPALYFDYEQDKVLGKSEDQKRRWRNPRIKAFKNLAHVLGDKDVHKLTREDALRFRDWGQGRVMDGMTPNSANKDLSYILSTLRKVIDRQRLPIDNPFFDLKFSEVKKSRPPFSQVWIAENFTVEKLNGLNDQARDVLLVMINTGCRPSEICGLLTDDIRLSDNIPHIKIRSNDARALKNQSSQRDMPLVGIALDAMRRHPEGFARYRGKDKFSDTVNKYLRKNGLLESAGHSAYSLRHSFEDRMLALNLPDRLAAELMGHALKRERYGAGPSLAQKADVVSRLAI